MGALLQSAVPFLPATLGTMLCWMVAPLVGEVGRRRVALLFGLGAIGLLVFAFQQASTPRALEVFNPFPIGESSASTPVLIENTEAPGWSWPLTCAVFYALSALWMFGGARGSVRAPSPALYGTFVSTLFIIMRLMLEKDAAPAGLVWATGVSLGLPLIVGFVGYYAGSQRRGYVSMLGSVLILAVMQRSIIVAIGWFATTRSWGTHLDVGAVTELNTPLGGLRHFGPDDLADKWTWAILVPQLALWVGITFALGVIVGGFGWMMSSNRR